MVAVLPYTSILIDGDWKVFFNAVSQCLKCLSKRDEIEQDIRNLWVNNQNKNHVLPCLSVRTGLDLYLTVMNFAPGSEIIMSAVNIPDMLRVIKQYNLRVVPIDIDIETTAPKLEFLPYLISDKTVAILVAHIFGKWFDMEPVIQAAKAHKLAVIEDCAEGFCGFQRIGHPESDLALFSFGVIKYCTALGGGIAKIRDEMIYSQMSALYNTYPVQSTEEYLKKILKYFFAHSIISYPNICGPLMYIAKTFHVDYKQKVVKLLRGFPDQMCTRIKHRPSTALLSVMLKRFKSFNQSEFDVAQIKGEYVRMRLPEEAQMIGMKSMVNNYWLFPILLDNPDTVQNILNAMGVDAYRGATQLNIIEPEPTTDITAQIDPRYPREARYLIDHVIYLPVQKFVPFSALNKICDAVGMALKLSKDAPKVRLLSKL